MQIVHSLDEARSAIGSARAAVTFGVFDGLHVGHQELMGSLVECAREAGGPSVVLTFREHPLRLLAPAYAPRRLNSIELQTELLGDLGVDLVAVVDFDREFAALPPEKFVEDVIVGAFRAHTVYTGFNNRFGRDGQGDTALMQSLGESHGFKVVIVEPREWKGSLVSSTRMRQLLRDGRVRKANAILGRRHVIEGTVVEGDRRGRELGFPTANLGVAPDLLIPCPGVYAVRGRVGETWHGGMMNIGHRPTFGHGALHVEVHLFDFDAEIYGQALRVELIERLRGEQRFPSPEALVDQLRQDEAAARAAIPQE